MATQPESDEAEIRRRIEHTVEAIRGMDVDGVMSIYAPDIVSFDVEPPLAYHGADAKRRAWLNVFAIYNPPLDYETRDLTITIGDDVAFGHSLNRLSGTLKSGDQTGMWVRWTPCFRKIDGRWLIVHEQVSVPVDPKSARAQVNLEP